MKNLVLLFITASLIVLASCGEAKLEKDIEGVWRISKYVVNGTDNTAQLNAARPHYTWKFDKNKNISRYWETPYDSAIFHIDTVWSGGVMHRDTSWSYISVMAYQGSSGTWQLINGNKYIQITDSSSVEEYKIIEHKSSSLHLFNNGEDYYLQQW